MVAKSMSASKKQSPEHQRNRQIEVGSKPSRRSSDSNNMSIRRRSCPQVVPDSSIITPDMRVINARKLHAKFAQDILRVKPSSSKKSVNSTDLGSTIGDESAESSSSSHTVHTKQSNQSTPSHTREASQRSPKMRAVSQFQEHKRDKPSPPERICGSRGRSRCHSVPMKKSIPPRSTTPCHDNSSMYCHSQPSSAFSSRAVKSVGQSKFQKNRHGADQKASGNTVCSNASNSNYQVGGTLLDPTHCIPFISTSQALFILTKLPLNSPLFVKRTSRDWTYAKLVGRHQDDYGETRLEVILEYNGKLMKVFEEKKWKKNLMLVNQNATASSASSILSEADDFRSFSIESAAASTAVDTMMCTLRAYDQPSPLHRTNSAPEPRRGTKYVSFQVGTFSASDDDDCNSSASACNSVGKLRPPSLGDMAHRTLRRVESLDSISSKDVASDAASSTNQELSDGNAFHQVHIGREICFQMPIRFY